MDNLTTDLPAYPPAVLKAYSVVFQHKLFKELTAKSREILGEIVLRLSVHNLERPIWFKRQNVAAKLQCDRKTVYNALRKLEQGGLIERHEQNVTAEGFYECSSISATPALIRMLGLGPAKGYQQGTSAQNPSRGENSGRINKGVNNVNSVNIQPSGAAKKTSNQKPKKPLWEDEQLAFLRDAGFSANGVFALMGLCKKNRQRLSSVVACLKLKLEQLSKRQMYAYLKTCITSGANFTKKEVDLQTDAAARARLMKYRIWLGMYLGKTLKNKAGRTIEVLDGASPVSDSSGVHLGAIPTQQAFDMFESGEFKLTLTGANPLGSRGFGNSRAFTASEGSRMREHASESNRLQNMFAQEEEFLRNYEGRVLRTLRGGYVNVQPGMCSVKDVDGRPEASISLTRVIDSFRNGFLFF